MTANLQQNFLNLPFETMIAVNFLVNGRTKTLISGRISKSIFLLNFSQNYNFIHEQI